VEKASVKTNCLDLFVDIDSIVYWFCSIECAYSKIT